MKRKFYIMIGMAFGGLCAYFLTRKPSISLGCVTWRYWGDNMSALEVNGKTLIGPGYIELMSISNYVYGIISDQDMNQSRWFVISKNTRKLFLADSAEQVEMLVVRDKNEDSSFAIGFRYNTFQTQMENRLGGGFRGM